MCSRASRGDTLAHIQTLWQVHDAHAAAGDQVAHSVLSERVVRQPAQDGEHAEQQLLQSGPRTPATAVPQLHTMHLLMCLPHLSSDAAH